MVTYLLENGKIETTVTRAKDVRSMAEKMITLGKASDLHTKRQVYAYITKEDVAKKLFDEDQPQVRLTATAATPASSRSALAAATLLRWQFWSSRLIDSDCINSVTNALSLRGKGFFCIVLGRAAGVPESKCPLGGTLLPQAVGRAMNGPFRLRGNAPLPG